MHYLIDTNIISELAKTRPNIGIMDWAAKVRRCALSVITLEELYYGLSWNPNQRISQWLEKFIDEYTEIIHLTPTIAKRAGILRGQFQAKGLSRSQADILIASTASEYSLTLVTRNTRDFKNCGIELLDPFI